MAAEMSKADWKLKTETEETQKGIDASAPYSV